MPVYMHCPHCDHPQIVPMQRRGRMRFCRQCGRAYVTSQVADEVRPVPVTSIAEMEAITRSSATAGRPSGRRVYVLA